MSSETAATSSSSSSSEMPLHGVDIAQVLSSKGPVVQCVLLQAIPESETQSQEEDDSEDVRVARLDLDKAHMKQIELDTTPAKSMVAKTLGGPFTFLGQYEDEGIVLMIRDFPESLEWMDEIHDEEGQGSTAEHKSHQEQCRERLGSMKMSELKSLCSERDISLDNVLEKSDLVDALWKWWKNLPPTNGHHIPPPLDATTARGNILILKVAETDEALDEAGEDDQADVQVPSNDEFFLNYTIKEYLEFASQKHPDPQENDEETKEAASDDENDSEEEKEDDAEEGFVLGEDEQMEDEDKAAMFNLVMNEVLRQYREEHGRGPNTQELLEIRSNIAKELDVKVAEIAADQADWNRNAKDGTPAKETPKKIGFSKEDSVLEYEPDPAEHDHHRQESDDDVYDDNDEEEEDEGDAEPEDYAQPQKRQKTSHSPDEEEEDTKPAAVATNSDKNAADTAVVARGDGGESTEGQKKRKR